MEFTLKDFNTYWHNKGVLPNGEKVALKDALALPDAPVLMPKVIENIVKEAQEPLLIGTSLLTQLPWSYGQRVTFPAVGALHAFDVPEGGEFPEVSLQVGGSTVTASIGKVGLAFKMTEEMIDNSQFDLVNMYLRAAGAALARHKEQKIFNFIRTMGATIFDNVNPTASLKGVCTGRDITGSQNGSCTMDDFFDTYAHVLMQGFTPDTVLMNPLMWSMWVKDPTLRAFALNSGGGTFFAGWNGDARSRNPWMASSQGGLGSSVGQNLVQGPAQAGFGGGGPSGPAGPGPSSPTVAASGLTEFSPELTSAPQVPSYFPFPLRVLVSPLVPFDPVTKTSDIYVFASGELGALLVNQLPTVDEWEDKAHDIVKMKIKEKYAVAIMNEGHGIGVMKNVKLVPNNVVLPAQTQLDITASGLDFDFDTPIL